MSRKPWPDPWRSLLESKGFDSRRRLAERSGVSTQTIVRLVEGDGEPADDTVKAVAVALGVGPDEVWKLAGYDRHDYGPIELPSGATRLTREQRKAVIAVVHAMLSPAHPEVAPTAEGPHLTKARRGRVKAEARRTEDNETTQSPDAEDSGTSGRSA